MSGPQDKLDGELDELDHDFELDMDAPIGASFAAALRDLQPGASVWVAAGAGHAPFLSRPEATAARIRDFLDACRPQVAPAGALVNGQGDILYLHGRTGMYLEPAPGEAGVSNILTMAREGLRRELGTALYKALTSTEPVRAWGLRVKTNGHHTLVNLSVRSVARLPRNTLRASCIVIVLAPSRTLPAVMLATVARPTPYQSTP